MRLRHLDLFSGIGGNSLAADSVWGDIEHTFCEIDPYCRAVLKKHWPNAIIHEDIRTLDPVSIGPVDLVTGGFPCQPFSNAGKRKGKEDDRDLWPEMLRVIKGCRPTWVIGENVAGFIGMELDRSISDLEGEGYAVQAFDIPAVAVDAPHLRHRIWIVAYRESIGIGRLSVQPAKGRLASKGSKPHGRGKDVSDTDRIRRDSRRIPEQREAREERTGQTTGRRRKDVADSSESGLQGRFVKSDEKEGREKQGRSHRLRSRSRGGDYCKWAAEPKLGRVAHGIPSRVDRVKSLGNSIVPQVAAEIMRAVCLQFP